MSLEITWVLASFFFLAGALIGSFLNVCIVRLPRNESVVFPASHCVHCKAPVLWFDNIPLISFLVLRGKCRSCSGRISERYFAVELLTGAVFLFSYFWMGVSSVLVPSLTLVCCLLVASCVDLEWRIIPDEVSVGGMWAGFILSFFFPGLHKGPEISVLSTGAVVASSLAGACMLFYAAKIFLKRMTLDREDRMVFFLGAIFLVGQWAAQSLAVYFPMFSASLTALSDALQGAVIGACALWLTGLIGEVLITKRVVTEFDFKGMVQDPPALIEDLRHSGYVDGRGNLQSSFRSLTEASALKLALPFEPNRRDIFEMLRAVDEGGVMGWGDVKLLAMAGAFLGWQLTVVSFFIAPFFGAAAGLVKMFRRQDTAIAYGPFLSIGIVVSLYGGDRLIHGLLRMYGLN